MKVGDKLTVTAIYSITGNREEVTVNSVDWNSMTCVVTYSSNYKETLPFSAFEGH